MRPKPGRCVRKCTENLLLRAVFVTHMTPERMKNLPVCSKCSNYHDYNMAVTQLKRLKDGVHREGGQ